MHTTNNFYFEIQGQNLNLINLEMADAKSSYSLGLYNLVFQDRSEKGALICSKICPIKKVDNPIGRAYFSNIFYAPNVTNLSF